MAVRFPQFGRIERQDLVADRIRIIASDIRRLCGQRRKLPFDPRACASFLGISVTEVPMPSGIYGRTSFGPIGPRIEVRGEDSETRKRFTLSHELAHLCFLDGKPSMIEERYKSYFTDVVSKREERLCDGIAAEVLMPQRSFLRRARMFEPSAEWKDDGPERIESAVKQLKLEYGTSSEAVLQRICDVRAWSLGLARWSLTSLERLRCRISVARGVRPPEAQSTRRRIDEALGSFEKTLRSQELLLDPSGPAARSWHRRNGLLFWLRVQPDLSGRSLRGVVISPS